jgi:hypothetical protein
MGNLSLRAGEPKVGAAKQSHRNDQPGIHLAITLIYLFRRPAATVVFIFEL